MLNIESAEILYSLSSALRPFQTADGAVSQRLSKQDKGQSEGTTYEKMLQVHDGAEAGEADVIFLASLAKLNEGTDKWEKAVEHAISAAGTAARRQQRVLEGKLAMSQGVYAGFNPTASQEQIAQLTTLAQFNSIVSEDRPLGRQVILSSPRRRKTSRG